ncbi:hypothetical protein TNIN_48641 [Trichonephila inaurata madagascariensis]|uniref:Uncharacterized protein n=1 Tax=Trichonephila inaurata madagascariensis TaxID=2747483 RepID=A0A8X6XCA0_9ARAC|nr:hypothetical protein TNIN_48641 [Trichonephila inaurata madagascariensis]
MPSRGRHGNDSPASLNAHVPQNHYSALIFPILEQRTRWVHHGNFDPSGPQHSICVAEASISSFFPTAPSRCVST